MPVPAAATYTVPALVAAHSAFRDLVDGGFGAGSIKIRDASDVLLAQIPLQTPCGAVDPGTGQLVITPGGRDESAAATGEAAYGEFCDGSGEVLLALPAAAGASAQPGKIVISDLAISAGGPVALVSATIG